MKLLNKWPAYYKKDVVTHYCPGCGHGIVHRIVAELLEEMNLGKRAVCVNPAGCAVLAYKYFDIDMIESAHGRGTAIATGVKRVKPELFVFTYQGDGDLSAIGTAETIQSPTRRKYYRNLHQLRGLRQTAASGPHHPGGQRTTTSPSGRNPSTTATPPHHRLIAQFPGVIFAERVAWTGRRHPADQEGIQLPFRCRWTAWLFLVEVLSPCPPNGR
jgi:2-oxoglutarate ferredoxin oxidoreductase subunit beta